MAGCHAQALWPPFVFLGLDQVTTSIKRLRHRKPDNRTPTAPYLPTTNRASTTTNTTTTMPPPRPQPHSRLLTLPQELRDIIHSHLLTHPAPINTNRLTRRYGDDRARVDAWLALSFTCKQLHAEAHTIFFRTNTFTFYIMRPLPRLPAQCLVAIRSFCLYRWRLCGVAELRVSLADGRLKALSVEATEDVYSSGRVMEGSKKRAVLGIRALEKAALGAGRLLKEGVEGVGWDVQGLQEVADALRVGWAVVPRVAASNVV